MSLLSHSLLRVGSPYPIAPSPKLVEIPRHSPVCAALPKGDVGELKCSDLQDGGGSARNGRRVWRRRKLGKKDERVQYGMERIPFLEEQVRKIRETGKIISMDIERLLLSEENRFAFVNDVAAEATSYVENDPDEYGSKKAILHVLSNRINDSGFHRSEAYLETDPFKPGPNYFKDELYEV